MYIALYCIIIHLDNAPSRLYFNCYKLHILLYLGSYSVQLYAVGAVPGVKLLDQRGCPKR
jgi:hypothetical protein